MTNFRDYIKEGFFGDMLNAVKEGMIRGLYKHQPELFQELLSPHIGEGIQHKNWFRILKKKDPNSSDVNILLSFLIGPIEKMVKAEGGIKPFQKRIKAGK